jgi:septal ring factor EnvC (AmiA/AmiB activator)
MDITKAARRIQRIGDVVEKLVQQSNEVRERIVSMEDTVETTDERVAKLERRVERQSALLEALAHREGIDVETVAGTVEDAEPIDPTEAATDEDAADVEKSTPE